MTKTLVRCAAAVLLALCSTATAPAETAAPFPWPDGAKAAVALTYDDAIDGHLDVVAPDLDAASLRGTFYVTGSSESLRRRLPEWRALAARGHELANHAIFHPCLRNLPGRGFVPEEYALESYSTRRITDELAAMNTTLSALDGETVRTFAYGCTDTTAGPDRASYVDAIRPLFLSARIGGNRVVEDPRAVDLLQVPAWMVQNATGEQMIAFARQALEKGGLAVFLFHGVGGGHSISVERDAHRQLLAWLAANRKAVWTDTFRAVTARIASERRPAAAR